MTNKKKITIIGAGFSGMAAAATLAREGMDVTVIERHDIPGGRGRQFSAQGFTFDMGPSWYWMPDVIDDFFARFDRRVSDYFELKRLDPSYRIYFGKEDYVEIPASMEEAEALFEGIEPGAGAQLRAFMKEAEVKYTVGIGEFANKPCLSIMEFAQLRLLKYLFSMHLLRSFRSHISRYFKSPRIQRMLEFPILFLGGTGRTTPALYSMMNYGDIKLGTWYPMGGMHQLARAMHRLAEEQGVTFHFSTEATRIDTRDGKAVAVETNQGRFEADFVIASGDYHHMEQVLLPREARTYDQAYWDKRVMSPSSLIFYMGVNRKLEGLLHHTLLFDADFEAHAAQIYEDPQWPTEPSLYINVTSQTDPSVAPEGQENLMVLIPVAPGLEDTPAVRDRYYTLVMDRIEAITGQSIREHVVYCRSYAHNDFTEDYHAFKGNAYGLANTLMQTAFLKPRMQSRKLDNLYFAGQLTVPGPGVPPTILSGTIAAGEILGRCRSQS
ncbi:phytoene desaturase family protein [Ectothiorhodospira lacustris]|uniref:phytoene desaturase family protein n=1 Tax=Ectothiorhodospira lacustris TaxID=2899127 RepID=UPI001EE9622F|nr:phytoene desaturase family protein [Ectothiorhodospira lacustris]MCG5511201.1 phytoene desaturase [Ectothiorhodospira lacustris]MCG5522983.1 phytoene desaturase [Ectothiorhodospira lacustris]